MGGLGIGGIAVLLMLGSTWVYVSTNSDFNEVYELEVSPPEPADNELPESSPGPMARLLYRMGEMPMLVPAKVVDHEAPLREGPDPEVSAHYGGYLAQTCIGCHGSSFSGGAIPGMPPGTPRPRT